MIGSGSSLAISLAEDFFYKGKSFTYQDYENYGAAEVKDFIFDPTVYDPPEGSAGRIIGYFPSVFAEAGPILVDFYAGVIESGDGTPQALFNRDGTNAKQFADSTLKLNPTTITDVGTRFTGIGVPANATGSGQQVSSSVEDELPFEINPAFKYLIRVTNTNGAGTLVTIRFTIFEI